jgi:hypothetical protein
MTYLASSTNSILVQLAISKFILSVTVIPFNKGALSSALGFLRSDDRDLAHVSNA